MVEVEAIVALDTHTCSLIFLAVLLRDVLVAYLGEGHIGPLSCDLSVLHAPVKSNSLGCQLDAHIENFLIFALDLPVDLEKVHSLLLFGDFRQFVIHIEYDIVALPEEVQQQRMNVPGHCCIGGDLFG